MTSPRGPPRPRISPRERAGLWRELAVVLMYEPRGFWASEEKATTYRGESARSREGPSLSPAGSRPSETIRASTWAVPAEPHRPVQRQPAPAVRPPPLESQAVRGERRTLRVLPRGTEGEAARRGGTRFHPHHRCGDLRSAGSSGPGRVRLLRRDYPPGRDECVPLLRGDPDARRNELDVDPQGCRAVCTCRPTVRPENSMRVYPPMLRTVPIRRRSGHEEPRGPSGLHREDLLRSIPQADTSAGAPPVRTARAGTTSVSRRAQLASRPGHADLAAGEELDTSRWFHGR